MGSHLFFFGCQEVNSTWLITSELANQRVRKALFNCVVYSIEKFTAQRVNSTLNFTRKTDITRMNRKVMSAISVFQVKFNDSEFGRHFFLEIRSFPRCFFPSTSCIFVFMIAAIIICLRLTSAISLHAHMQFHAKQYMYPLFDSPSDREFTFSYVILTQITQKNACSKSFICI